MSAEEFYKELAKAKENGEVSSNPRFYLHVFNGIISTFQGFGYLQEQDVKSSIAEKDYVKAEKALGELKATVEECNDEANVLGAYKGEFRWIDALKRTISAYQFAVEKYREIIDIRLSGGTELPEIKEEIITRFNEAIYNMNDVFKKYKIE